MNARPALAGALVRGRRAWAVAVAAIGLLLLLGTLATAIVLAQEQSRSQVRTNFSLRGTSSATLVSTYLSEQAAREQQTARRLLSGGHVSAARFSLVVSAFGGSAGGLLDSRGRLIGVVPSDPTLIGRQFATRYRHFEVAERGKVAISNVVSSAVQRLPVMAVAVPFSTARGRRVFSVAYRSTGSTLDAFVDHAIAYPQHEVLLLDGTGRLLAASPRTSADTLPAADPPLARAAAHGARGSVPGAGTPSTFTSAHVPGTDWRLVLAVPNSHLYNSISGWSRLIPWIVFALVSLLGVLLVAQFSRSLADQARLATLSGRLERTARTDSLTGLYNRRALTEHLTRLTAHARRRGDPLSVLMIDLDRFKQTNDGFGHDAGDEVLCTVADCMREALRADDVYGRWGGDEFLIALPATGEEGAGIVLERLREAAAAAALENIGLPDGVPLSIGAATGIHASPQDLVRAADLALYEAKAVRSHSTDGRPVGSPSVR